MCLSFILLCFDRIFSIYYSHFFYNSKSCFTSYSFRIYRHVKVVAFRQTQTKTLRFCFFSFPSHCTCFLSYCIFFIRLWYIRKMAQLSHYMIWDFQIDFYQVCIVIFNIVRINIHLFHFLFTYPLYSILWFGNLRDKVIYFLHDWLVLTACQPV